MSRLQMFSSTICFSALSFVASFGVAQEFYQASPSFNQTYSYPSYSVQELPIHGATYVEDVHVNQSHYVNGSAFEMDSVVPVYSSSETYAVEVPVQTSNALPTETVSGELSEINGKVIYSEGTMPPLVSRDYGYDGPGDMRTHLWNDHSSEMKQHGISHDQVMAMPMEKVQKWHNFFHGSEGKPAP